MYNAHSISNISNQSEPKYNLSTGFYDKYLQFLIVQISPERSCYLHIKDCDSDHMSSHSNAFQCTMIFMILTVKIMIIMLLKTFVQRMRKYIIFFQIWRHLSNIDWIYGKHDRLRPIQSKQWRASLHFHLYCNLYISRTWVLKSFVFGARWKRLHRLYWSLANSQKSLRKISMQMQIEIRKNDPNFHTF